MLRFGDTFPAVPNAALPPRSNRVSEHRHALRLAARRVLDSRFAHKHVHADGGSCEAVKSLEMPRTQLQTERPLDGG
ncbi:MAG: hypothetical protein DCC68_02865 [Planctomycetota bacterium]|nr:MAG: hypothetical protein DCC68_02865 [Planctomycetota bacterium]